MKTLDELLARMSELCEEDEVEQSFSEEELHMARSFVAASHATPVGRPTTPWLLAFAEAVAESRASR